MKTELTRKALDIYEKFLDLEVGELEDFLNRECWDNLELRHEVERLLASADKSGDDSQLRFNLDPSLFEDDAPDNLFSFNHFQEIGIYKIEKLIGEGGMGTVYLGVRKDLKSVKVAVKVFKNGWNESFRRRFISEREILANLKHRNIASFIDCGTEGETPYLVMEYVEGVPLDVYCEKAQLSLKKRLDIILQICDAISYSHRHFIVHRDLKPSNILVTPDGEAKLLDFGIAKIINPEIVKIYHLEKTNPLFSVMTPLYASPEQIDGKEPISVASDVFALGLILYKILTGRLPYPPGCDRHKLLDCIRTQEPEKPSSVLRQALKQSSPAVSSSEPDSHFLQEAIPSDIDNIVLKALEKDPARRYAGVEQFAEDINRYFKGLPVSARAHTLSYRTGKFFRRNKLVITTTASFILLLVIGAAAFFSQAAQTVRERDKAQKISDFLTNLFEQSDPYLAKGENTTVREMLDHGTRKVEDELTDQPEAQARLLHVMGRTFHRIGVFNQAITLQESSLRIYREKLDSSAPEATETMTDLAMTYIRLSKSPQDDFLNKAESLLSEALGIERANRGDNHPSVARILRHQVWLLLSKRRPAEAEKTCREALHILLENFGEENREVAEAINILGITLHEQERLAEAEMYYRQAIAVNRRVSPENDIRAIPPRENLAWLLKETGNYAESEPEFRQIIKVYKERLPNGNPESAGTIVGLGMLLAESGRFAEAETVLREGLEMRRKMLGDNHWETAYTLSELGWCLANLKRFEEAETYLRNGLPLYVQREGEKGADTVKTLKRLIKLYEMWGRPTEAEKYRARLTSERISKPQ